MDLNGNERVIIHLCVPENYGFDIIISDYYSYQLFQKPRFDTNVGLLLFLRVTLSKLRPFTRHKKYHHSSQPPDKLWILY